MNVVRGNPTAEELAAVIAVVASRAASPAGGSPGRPVSVWSDRSRNIHRVPHPGPTAWRSSTWPL